MNQERKARLDKLDQKAQIPWNSLKEAEVLVKEFEDILATESQESFSSEELNKISLISLSMFARDYEFLNKVVSGEKQLDDDELKGIEKGLNNLPEQVKTTEYKAKIYENAGLRAAANSQREVIKILKGDYKSTVTNAIQKEKTRRRKKPNKDDTDEQITALRSKIKALEDKIRDNNSDSDIVRQYQQELQKLKVELQKKQEQRERESKNQPIILLELLVAEQ